LARRAGELARGRTAVREALEAQRAKLVILSCDASSRTSRTFEKLAGQKNVPVAHVSKTVELGAVLGTAPTAVCAVCSESFASGVGAALGLSEFAER
jgi:ribosomal protein L7Ae-like RNA K-turn-binding protein